MVRAVVDEVHVGLAAPFGETTRAVGAMIGYAKLHVITQVVLGVVPSVTVPTTSLARELSVAPVPQPADSVGAAEPGLEPYFPTLVISEALS